MDLPQPRNLLSLTVEEKRAFLESFDYIFSDLDGVVWRIDQSIEGSSVGFALLRMAGKILNFITNNNSRSEEEFINKLKHMGLEIESENFINPIKCIVDYLKSISFEGSIYVIGTEPLKNVLRNSDFSVIDGPNETIGESYTEFISCILNENNLDENVKAVLIDHDFNTNYVKLNKALYYLRDPEVILICGTPDTTAMADNGVKVVAPGTFAQAIQTISERNLLLFGKPNPLMAQIMCQRYNINNTQRVLIIGDTLNHDIAFGKSAGFQTLFVLTGVNNLMDVKQQKDKQFIPDYYIASIEDFRTFFEELA